MTEEGIICLCIIWTTDRTIPKMKEEYKDSIFEFLRKSNERSFPICYSVVGKKIRLRKNMFCAIIENSMYYNTEYDIALKVDNYSYFTNLQYSNIGRPQKWPIDFNIKLAKKSSKLNVFETETEIVRKRFTFRPETQYKTKWIIYKKGRKYYSEKEAICKV